MFSRPFPAMENNLMKYNEFVKGRVEPKQNILSKPSVFFIHMSWFTPTRALLKKCRWLSVKQLVFYHRVVTAHKIVKTNSPLYLHQRMTTTHPYPTRQATGGAIRFGEQFSRKSLLAGNSFCYSGTQDYNRIPADIRNVQTLKNFKFKLRKWVTSNIPED